MNIQTDTPKAIQEKITLRAAEGESLLSIAKKQKDAFVICKTEWHTDNIKHERYMITNTETNLVIGGVLYVSIQEAKKAYNLLKLKNLLQASMLALPEWQEGFLEVLQDCERIEIEKSLIFELEGDSEKVPFINEFKGKIELSVFPF